MTPTPSYDQNHASNPNLNLNPSPSPTPNPIPNPNPQSGDRVALAQRIHTDRQPANARVALDLLLSRAEMAARYEMLI